MKITFKFLKVLRDKHHIPLGLVHPKGHKGIPEEPVTKESIEVVVTDDIEKYKRNKTFRKSLRLSFKRPVSSPAQVCLLDCNCKLTLILCDTGY